MIRSVRIVSRGARAAVRAAPRLCVLPRRGSRTAMRHVHSCPALFSAGHDQPPLSCARKVALYAGSFAPPSEGHLDIIKRGLNLCDELIVGVAVNPSKKYVFNTEERVGLVEAMCAASLGAEAQRLRVVAFEGLVVDFARDNDVDFLVRGLRAFSDFEYEFRMALINRKLTGIETSFLMADERMSFVSSSLIREVAAFGKMLPNFVPQSIQDPVFERLGVSEEAAAALREVEAQTRGNKGRP